MSPPPIKRHQSQTERDIAGFAARKERDAAPVEIPMEITENYTGDQLKEMRAKRPTDERIGRLEEKHDKLSEAVFRMEGKLDTALSVIVPEAHKTERHRMDSRTKVILALIGAAGAAIGVIVTALSGCA